MTKKKSNLLRTSENKRSSLYGEYYISVKRIGMIRGMERGYELSPDFYPYARFSFGCPMFIKAVFETDKENFGKARREKWKYNLSISVNVYTMGECDVSHFDISIYFPSLTTLNIIKGKCFLKLLLRDKEVYEALTYSLNFLSDLPGTPPLSAFEGELKRQIVDLETRLKLQIGYPIAFEDIEEAQDMEIREQALKKFGYEDYVKEGFKNDKVTCIKFNGNNNLYNLYINPSLKLPPFSIDYHDEFRRTVLLRGDDEKIICFRNGITFLQVKDTSTNKTYFLKVPPTMGSVEEAKAWTFGLERGEYSPAIET